MAEHTREPYGELFYCKVCMGMEGTLTEDCSGKLMSPEQERDVYAGYLDYRKGKGWVQTLSSMGRGIIANRYFRQKKGVSSINHTEIYKGFPATLVPEILEYCRVIERH